MDARDVRSFQPYTVTVDCDGEAFLFHVADEVGREWYDVEGSGRGLEMRFIREWLIERGGLVVECGCHHGFNTILLSRWVGPEGEVLALDANAGNVEVARQNVRLNECWNAHVRAKAVAEFPGILAFSRGSNGRVARRGNADTVDVEAACLDDLLAGRTPTCIKIDVEGYEAHVLRGLQNTLVKRETNLSIEVHGSELPYYGSTVQEVLKLAGVENSICWVGYGAEAREGIRRYVPGEVDLPDGQRFYLFVQAANMVTSGRSHSEKVGVDGGHGAWAGEARIGTRRTYHPHSREVIALKGLVENGWGHYWTAIRTNSSR